GIDEPGLPGLESVLQPFTQGPFIGRGPAFWGSISGDVTPREFAGHTRGLVKSCGALDQRFQRSLNLWVDLSSGSEAGTLALNCLFDREFLIRDADRQLFGRNYLKPGRYVPKFKVLASFEISADLRSECERSGVGRLFGIKV